MKNLHNKIEKVFAPREYLAWWQVYMRLKLPVSRNNWDYIRAWQDMKANGRLQEGQNNTYRLNT